MNILMVMHLVDGFTMSLSETNKLLHNLVILAICGIMNINAYQSSNIFLYNISCC